MRREVKRRRGKEGGRDAWDVGGDGTRASKFATGLTFEKLGRENVFDVALNWSLNRPLVGEINPRRVGKERGREGYKVFAYFCPAFDRQPLHGHVEYVASPDFCVSLSFTSPSRY